MTILVTGASGFSAQSLKKHIPQNSIFLTRKTECSQFDGMRVLTCDLLDYESVHKAIETIKPSKIFHLSGSFSNIFEIDNNANVVSTRNIFESVKNVDKSIRILIIGSAAEYGLIDVKSCPVKETQPENPSSIYGLTKVYQKQLMDFYVRHRGLDILMARPFNLSGKGCSAKLFIGKVYAEIEKFKQGLSEHIKLGNLESSRDYLEIDDATQHYVKIIESGDTGEIYNVGSGQAIKIRKILEKILKDEGVDMSVVVSDSSRRQDNDSDVIYSDISKLKGLYNA